VADGFRIPAEANIGRDFHASPTPSTKRFSRTDNNPGPT
jgi:hypothetical protein